MKKWNIKVYLSILLILIRYSKSSSYCIKYMENYNLKSISGEITATPMRIRLHFFFSRKHYVVCDNQINLVSPTGTLYKKKSIKLQLLTIAFIYSDKGQPSLMDIGYSIFENKKKKNTRKRISKITKYEWTKTICIPHDILKINNKRYKLISTKCTFEFRKISGKIVIKNILKY